MITFVDVESDLPKDILDEAIKIFLASIAEKTTIKDAIKKVCKSVLMQTVAYLDKISDNYDPCIRCVHFRLIEEPYGMLKSGTKEKVSRCHGFSVEYLISKSKCDGVLEDV